MNPIVFMLAIFGLPAFVLFWLCRISLGGWSSVAVALLVALMFCLGNALHELSHATAVWAFGGTITDVHLVPNVFRGDFIAYVRYEAHNETPLQMTVTILAPYLVDIAILTLVLLCIPHIGRWNQVMLSGVILFGLVRPLGSLMKEALFLLRNVRCDFGDLITYVGKIHSSEMVIGLLLAQLALSAMIVVGIRKMNG